MTKLFFTIVIFTLTIAACNKSQSVGTHANADGKIIGGIGCSAWLIQLDNNIIIQPTNLSSFNITIQSGQRVSLSYQKSNDQLSTCIEGEVVDLFSIVDK